MRVTVFWGLIYVLFMQFSGAANNAAQGINEKQKLWASRMFGNLHEQSTLFLVAVWSYAIFVDAGKAAFWGDIYLFIRLFYPIIWAANGGMSQQMALVTLPGYIINLYLLGTVGFKVFFDYEGDHSMWWAGLLMAFGYFFFFFILSARPLPAATPPRPCPPATHAPKLVVGMPLVCFSTVFFPLEIVSDEPFF